MDPLELIAIKRDGGKLAGEQLRELILRYADEDGPQGDDVPDYQMAAFLMAGYVRGFNKEETAAMTEAMVVSGDRLDLSGLSGPTVDKHSTGGVGDGTTLIVAPLAAELGMQVVKLSGRGLGHTGGTLDKLEAIPGMRTDLSAEDLLAQVEDIGLAVSAQTGDLVPADRVIYALRDVTATVGSIPLIAASILSKKLAGGADTILIDVKTGSGAFMKELEDACELARACVELGQAAGRRTGALITDMSQPLSQMIGNAIEVREAIEVLRGERFDRLGELCVWLAGHLAWFAEIADDADDGIARARDALRSGAALERFTRFVEAQGGDPRVVEDTSLLPSADVVREIHSRHAAWLAGVDTEALGNAAASLGAGRRRKEDEIDPSVGLQLTVEVGDQVQSDTLIGRVFAKSEDDADTAEQALREALNWSEDERETPQLIYEVMAPGTQSTQVRLRA